MRKIYAIPIAAALLLTPNLVLAKKGPEKFATASECWSKVRQARTELTEAKAKATRMDMVDIIVDAEVAKRRQNYRACVDLAETAIRMGKK